MSGGIILGGGGGLTEGSIGGFDCTNMDLTLITLN